MRLALQGHGTQLWAVRRVTAIMGELNASTLEQSQRIGAVAQSLAQLDQMTQRNADFVEQSSLASNSLQEQARQLGEVVGVFLLQPTHHSLGYAPISR